MVSTDFKPSRELYPFESRWFNSPVGRIHYLDEGEGCPILLMHGNPTWSFLYRKLVPTLAASGFRCVVPDLLGYGLSEHPRECGFTAREQVDAQVRLVNALGFDELVVMGQDWGGPIALSVALQARVPLRGIVLGSTFAWPAGGLTRFIGHLLRLRAIQSWMVHGEGFIARVMGLVRTPIRAAELEHYSGVAATPELRKAKAVLPRELIDADEWLAALQQSVVERLGSVPALLIHAKRDGFSGASVRRLARLLPNNAILTLPHAGHFFPEDAPDEVAGAIIERFATQEDARSAVSQALGRDG